MDQVATGIRENQMCFRVTMYLFTILYKYILKCHSLISVMGKWRNKENPSKCIKETVTLRSVQIVQIKCNNNSRQN